MSLLYLMASSKHLIWYTNALKHVYLVFFITAVINIVEETGLTLIFYIFYNKDVFWKNIGVKGVFLSSMTFLQLSFCLWYCRDSFVLKKTFYSLKGWGGGGGLLTWFKDLIVVAVTPRGWECGYVLYEASEESTWSKEAFFFFFLNSFVRWGSREQRNGCHLLLDWKLVCKII